MSRPELRLSNQICFLVYRLNREINARYRPLLRDLGLTYPQYLIMLILWEQDGRTVGQLCSSLGLDTGTVSPLLKRMERGGLVTRTRDAGDERTVTVDLTPAGTMLEKRAQPVPKAIATCLGLSREGYGVLHSRLRTILGALETDKSKAS
jgi:MarR family transcriptional regulator, organic hydroperoxide resistance regulator